MVCSTIHGALFETSVAIDGDARARITMNGYAESKKGR
jgi:hypothetical protein